MKFTIPSRLDGLNTYTLACRNNRYGGNVCKKKNQKIVSLAIQQAQAIGALKPVENYPVGLKIKWFEKDSRRDWDNVTFAKKFIQDSLVNEGILMNDSRKFVSWGTDDVLVDKENPRIEVEIIESGAR